ncbi:MAG: SOS response-associated peptidase [Rhodospirillaceae bacterium]|nr:SOS response-associated peptidase [Rhodospirillaceae bacterium]
MCGRYVITSALEAIREAFGVPDPDFDWQANYNVAPSQMVPVVRLDPSGARQLTRLRWGLVPHWAREIPSGGNGFINARSETAAEKPSFRDAYRRQRCLVVADGYYEWQRRGTAKQPYLIAPPDGGPIAFAGLWALWTKGEAPLETCAILTTAATGGLEEIHDRMPVILDPTDWPAWLAAEGPPDPPPAPWPGDRLTAVAVEKRVGNPKNNDAKLLTPMRTLM